MKIQKSVTFNQEGATETLYRRLEQDMNKLFLALQSRLRFGDANDGAKGENISGEFQVLTTSATPNAENTIAHTVGSVPVGYLVMKRDKAAHVYLGTTAWTDTNVYLKSDVASVAVTIFLIK